jgi:hypothetical protein
MHFNIRQELRGILDLIDKERWLKTLKNNAGSDVAK